MVRKYMLYLCLHYLKIIQIVGLRQCELKGVTFCFSYVLIVKIDVISLQGASEFTFYSNASATTDGILMLRL